MSILMRTGPRLPQSSDFCCLLRLVCVCGPPNKTVYQVEVCMAGQLCAGQVFSQWAVLRWAEGRGKCAPRSGVCSEMGDKRERG